MTSGRMPKELLICGPAGTGKTHPILSVLHCLLRDYPGLRVLILRATRASLTESALVTYEQEILTADGCEAIAEGVQRSHRQAYHYANGSTLVVAGLDRAPSRVLSTAWDIVFANEATELREDAWETISSRLDRPGRSSRFGWLIADTNPSGPTHWLKRRCDSGKTGLWTTTHEANPTLFDGRRWTRAGRAYLSRLERTLTGVRYLRLRKGLWAGAEGLIYDLWDPAVHLLRGLPPGWRSWERMRSIDFGFTNPFVCGWLLIDDDGRMYLNREIYHTRRTVKVHAGHIKGLSEGESYEANVADHDAEDRATLGENGIDTVPAYKAVLPGINAVMERLKLAGDGRPRLYVVEGCRVERDPALVEARKPTCTEEEFAGYIWKPPQPGRAPKEEPVKENDHGMDMLRYAVAQVDGLGTYSAGAF
jgi:PBSX family phage terminase large subunit